MFHTRTLFAAASAGLSLLLSACDIVGGGHTGTYTLKKVNGKSLPAVIVEITGTYKAEITAGSVTLNEDKTYSASITFRETQGTTVTTSTDTDSGTYTISGNTVTFKSSDGSTVTGTLSGGTLTVTTQDNDITLIMVFEK